MREFGGSERLRFTSPRAVGGYRQGVRATRASPISTIHVKRHGGRLRRVSGICLTENDPGSIHKLLRPATYIGSLFPRNMCVHTVIANISKVLRLNEPPIVGARGRIVEEIILEESFGSANAFGRPFQELFRFRRQTGTASWRTFIKNGVFRLS